MRNEIEKYQPVEYVQVDNFVDMGIIVSCSSLRERYFSAQRDVSLRVPEMYLFELSRYISPPTRDVSLRQP